MIIISEHAERHVQPTLAKLQPEVPGYYCCYLSLAAFSCPVKDSYNAITSVLQSAPMAHACHVFFYDDGDVLFLAKGWKYSMFDTFIPRIGSKLGFDEGVIMHHSRVLDLWVDRDEINLICARKKHDVTERPTALAANNAIQLPHVKTCLSTVDAEVLASLQERRNKRRKPLIMIADDDSLSRSLVVNMLDIHHLSATSTDGVGTIKNYIMKSPDILFLDIGMPDISGHDILAQVFRFDPHAYIIMFSGHKNRTNVMKALELGASGFVGKPFSRKLIVDYIEKSPHVQRKQSACIHTR